MATTHSIQSRAQRIALAALVAASAHAAANPDLAASSEPAPSAIQTLPDPLAQPQLIIAAPPSESQPLGVPAPDARRASSTSSTSDWQWVQTLIALAAVLALIFLARTILQRLMRRTGGLAASFGPAGRAPSGVLEVLGRFPIARGQTLVLLRMDRRVLLLAQSSVGFRTLADVSDPDEVASLLIKSRDDEGATSAAQFNDLLRHMERDPATIAEERNDPAEPKPAGATGQRLARLKGIRA